MNKNIIALSRQLKIQLANKKPGQNAHKLMMPEGRNLSPQHTIPPIPSAVLIALYEKQNEIYFPIIRRPVYNGLHSGQMAFPGGKFEPDDNTLVNTALRESYEEVGINKTQVSVLGSLSPLYIPITNMEVYPIVGMLKNAPKYIQNKYEVDAIFEVRLNDILKPTKKETERWILRGNEVDVPFYNIQQQKIWGATAMILSELEQIILEISKTVT